MDVKTETGNKLIFLFDDDVMMFKGCFKDVIIVIKPRITLNDALLLND